MCKCMNLILRTLVTWMKRIYKKRNLTQQVLMSLKKKVNAEYIKFVLVAEEIL